jgi:tetratricopeptide (TPR) repeat protein
MTRENYELGLGYYKQALEVDPGYAAAYAGMANAYVGLWHFGHMAAEDSIPHARAAAQKAIDLDQELAEPHVALAALRLLYELDFVGAEAGIKTALRLNPNDSAAHEIYAVCLSALGRPEEAVEEAKLAWENDLLSPLTNLGLAGSLFHARRYEKAIKQFHKILRVEPNFLQAYECLAAACELAGKSDEAFDAHLKVLGLKGATEETIDRLRDGYSKSGMEGFWQTRYELIVESADRNSQEIYQLAQICSCLNDVDLAFEWLEKALSARSSRLVFLAVDPYLDHLRHDGRFQRISERLRLAK